MIGNLLDYNGFCLKRKYYDRVRSMFEPPTNSQPHVFFVALREISYGEEIFGNFGNR